MAYKINTDECLACGACVEECPVEAISEVLKQKEEFMIRDITIGQYYPANSKLHRLDPRVKIVCTLLYLISLFLINNIVGYIVAAVFLASMIRISKVHLNSLFEQSL